MDAAGRHAEARAASASPRTTGGSRTATSTRPSTCSSWTPATTGARVALGARGDVFTVTLAEKEKDKDAVPRNLTRTPGVREDYPRLSPDGTRVAYFSDATGEYQLYLRDLKTGDETALTSDLDRKVYHPRWSPDGKKLLFGDKDFALWVLDVATKKRTKVDGVAPARQRRVHLGGERLRVVAGQPLGRVLLDRGEPQQRDRALRHARGPQGRRSPTISTTTSTRASTPTAAISTSSRTATSRSRWTRSRTTTSSLGRRG